MVKSKIVKTANIVNTGTMVSSQSHGQQSQNLSCSKGQYHHTVYVVNKDNVVYMVKMVKRVNIIDKINIFNLVIIVNIVDMIYMSLKWTYLKFYHGHIYVLTQTLHS